MIDIHFYEHMCQFGCQYMYYTITVTHSLFYDSLSTIAGTSNG